MRLFRDIEICYISIAIRLLPNKIMYIRLGHYYCVIPHNSLLLENRKLAS